MDFIVNPDRFLRNVRNKIGYKVPILIVTLSGIAGAINGYIVADPMKKAVVRMLAEQGLPEKSIQAALTYMQISTIIMPLAMAFILWIAIAALIHAISSIFGGEGKFSTTLKLTAFSYIPNLVLFPLNLYVSFETAEILDVYGLSGLRGEFSLFTTAVGILTLIWQFVYWVFIAKNARELETKKAVVTALIVLSLFLIPSVYSAISKI